MKTRLLSEPFDAVIMSGKMPSDWNAKEAFLWLKKNCSEMEKHVLFTFSNGVEQGDERAFLQENNIPYLVKPFEVAELISQARRLLQKAKGGSCRRQLEPKSNACHPERQRGTLVFAHGGTDHATGKDQDPSLRSG